MAKVRVTQEEYKKTWDEKNASTRAWWYREYGKYSSHGIGSTGVRTYLTNYKSTLEQTINNAGRPGGLVVALECYLS